MECIKNYNKTNNYDSEYYSMEEDEPKINENKLLHNRINILEELIEKQNKEFKKKIQELEQTIYDLIEIIKPIDSFVREKQSRSRINKIYRNKIQNTKKTNNT